MSNVITINDLSENKLSTFYYSFLFLPKAKRIAINYVYAWCRATDEIVDSEQSKENKKIKLLKWVMEFEKGIKGKSENKFLNKVGNIISDYEIPIEHFFELISGMEMDIKKNRYNNFDELLEYSYKVASTVGLISAKIFGYKNIKTLEYAKNLGLALQLTNILRDIKKDAKLNRIYLPQDDLKNFNVSENDIINNVYNRNFKNLMKFEVERVKNYFDETTKMLPSEDKPLFIASEIMHAYYFKLLKTIEKKSFNVFNYEIKLSVKEKIIIAKNIWKLAKIKNDS